MWKVNEIYQNSQAKTNSDEAPNFPGMMGGLPFDMESLFSIFKGSQSSSGKHPTNSSTALPSESASQPQPEQSPTQPGVPLPTNADVEPVSAAVTVEQNEKKSDGHASDDMEMSEDEEVAAANSGTIATEAQNAENSYYPTSSVPSIPSSNDLQHSYALNSQEYMYSYGDQPSDAVFNGSNNVTTSIISSNPVFSSEPSSSWNLAVVSQPNDSYLNAHMQPPAPYNVQYFQPVHPCLLYTSPSPRDLSTSRMPSSA